MADEITRPELDAKLELIEARMDGRVASIEGKIDTLLLKMEHSDSILRDTKASVSGLRITVIVTAIATVVGLAGINATMLGGMVASFESGKALVNAINQAVDARTQAPAPAGK